MKSLLALAAAVVTGACTMSDPNLGPRSGAPSYVPAGAMPPTLSAAANDLGISTWQWQRTQLADGRSIVAAAPDRYTLRFEGGGRVLVRADCNRGSGSYEVNGSSMKVGAVALTRMGCPPGTQDVEFAQSLARVASYAIDGGELALTLADGGVDEAARGAVSPERWSTLMGALRIAAHVDTYERLAAAYSEPHRHYHTPVHIRSCLAELDLARGLATSGAEVEVALWFHDAIYSPTAADNEVRSARWATEFLADAGLSSAACERVHAHILATRHDAVPAAGDSALVVDIDLSILGQDRATYDAFEKDVRAEYRWVPWFLYRRKRREILESFLARGSIYTTTHSEIATRRRLG